MKRDALVAQELAELLRHSRRLRGLVAEAVRLRLAITRLEEQREVVLTRLEEVAASDAGSVTQDHRCPCARCTLERLTIIDDPDASEALDAEMGK